MCIGLLCERAKAGLNEMPLFPATSEEVNLCFDRGAKGLDEGQRQAAVLFDRHNPTMQSILPGDHGIFSGHGVGIRGRERVVQPSHREGDVPQPGHGVRLKILLAAGSKPGEGSGHTKVTGKEPVETVIFHFQPVGVEGVTLLCGNSTEVAKISIDAPAIAFTTVERNI
jgi:hypothetical protein